jgi:hypothetical protein
VEPALSGQCGRNSTTNRGEGSTEGVPDDLKCESIMGVDGRADDLVMARPGRRPGGWVRGGLLRTALDVGEEEGDRARGSSSHQRTIVSEGPHRRVRAAGVNATILVRTEP